jgi:hypothetical protein
MNTICKLFPFALAASAFATNAFFYNQAGYDSDKPVSIVVQSSDNLEGTEWTLFLATDGGTTGATVKSGTFGKGENPDNWSTNGKFYTIDLGSSLKAGKYSVAVAAGSPSTSDIITIADKALATSTLGLVMDYFYNDRADKSPVVGWDQKVTVYGSSPTTTRDVRGGWYDASGDVSKYLSHLSYANYLNPQQIPLTVWSLAFAAERIPTLLASTSTQATATEEALYGADFLVRMLDEQGFFYMTVFDNWGSGSRYLCAFSGEKGTKSANYQTAFREGGGMAIAALARVSKFISGAPSVDGKASTNIYLEAAEKAYAHLSEKQSIGGTCAYCDDGKENIIDDYTALLAATELYVATQNTTYLNDARVRAQHLADRISADGYFWSDDAKKRPYWHASDAGLPLFALVRYAEVEAPVSKDDWGCTTSLTGTCAHPYLTPVLDAIQKHYNWLINVTNRVENPFGYARQTYLTQNKIKDGFFIPHDNESDYWWQGEDARIASLAAAAVYADRALNGTVADSVRKYAADQLDWILGKNPYATCMMNGIGKKNPEVYNGQSEYDATLKGGIANGITGKNTDGSGIAWDDDGVAYVGFSSLEPWNNWRWIEQWLPHSTWYLMALATRYDEKAEKIQLPVSIKRTVAVAAGFDVKLAGRTLTVNAANAKSAAVTVVGLDGAKVTSGALVAGYATVDLSSVKSGAYLVKVDGFGAKKVLVR